MPAEEHRPVITLTVTGGVVADKPVREYTKNWTITQEEWGSPQRVALVADITSSAFKYAKTLQDPKRLTWVRVDWLWKL